MVPAVLEAILAQILLDPLLPMATLVLEAQVRKWSSVHRLLQRTGKLSQRQFDILLSLFGKCSVFLLGALAIICTVAKMIYIFESVEIYS